MDQPTPDPASTPGAEPRPPLPGLPDPSAKVVRRLQKRIETPDPIIAWTRGWVSREMRLHGMLAARSLDFAVLTERGIFFISTGFVTRRPRRCVYAARLDEIFVSHQHKSRGTRLRLASRKRRPLWLELRAGEQGTDFADALLARTRTPPT